MKRPTRILAIVGTLILLLLALLVVLPLLFRDRIAQRAKLEVNRSLDARVEWRDVGLTFFRNFPNLTLRLDDLTVAGKGRFEGDTLAAIRHFQVVLDLASVLGNVVGGEADRRPRRRARPAAAVTDRARGRQRQLGHHQEDP